MRKFIAAMACAIAFSATSQAQKFEGLANTPPMGWNSWNTFQCDISEKTVKDMADLFVDLGLNKCGYEYIVIDDGWMLKQRDKDGNLVPDPAKFPNGMKAVSDYVHSKGLKFGIYNCAGSETCGGYPGGRGHEYQDARLYASLGVDYLKYDWCNTGKMNAPEAYKTMRDALYTAGRPIVFSLCEWGDNQPWEWGAEIGHLWRTTGDIYCCYDCEYVVNKGEPNQWSAWGVWPILRMRKDIRKYAGPGHWNDPDMLEVGNCMNAAEDRSHFALWALSAAPLMLGNDLRKASKETIEIITNTEVIAVDQDKLGIQGYEYKMQDSVSIWVKPLDNNEWAIGFVNTSNVEKEINFDFKQNVVTDDLSGKSLDATKYEYTLRDLFRHENLKSTTKKPLSAKIASHDILMLRATIKK
jgi:alpha-galactosidase